MGNCWGVATAADDSHKALENTTDHKMMQQGLLRDRKMDVYEKYVEKEVLGQGSMGHVARVQIREGSEGGSAFHHSNGKKKLAIGTTSSSLMERRKEKVDYALKSILLDRVSPVYMTELQNEIDILKGMVSAREMLVCRARKKCERPTTDQNKFRRCRTTPISSRHTKYTPTTTEFTSFWSCAMEVICIRVCRTRKREPHRLPAS